MFEVVSQAAFVIACGVVWRLISPPGLDPAAARQVLTGLVYYLLLPALVVNVMWKAPLGGDSIRVALLAWVGLLSAMGLSWLWYRKRGTERSQLGALILAATFPNVTYLGLPVLEKTLGPWARGVALQYDLFACTPFLLSAGMMLARHYGTSDEPYHPLKALLKVPALWAAAVGMLLNKLGVPEPDWFSGVLTMLAVGVIPLMLISLGLSLRWPAQWRGQLALLTPAALIQLFVTPLLVWTVGGAIELDAQHLTAVVLEAAMPSMLLGVVVCDRYGLDTQLYSATVTVTTLLSLATLPLWFHLLV